MDTIEALMTRVTEGALVDPAPVGDRAGGVTGGEQGHGVAGGMQRPGQQVHHQLGAAVLDRRHGNPGRGDDPDAQT